MKQAHSGLSCHEGDARRTVAAVQSSSDLTLTQRTG